MDIKKIKEIIESIKNTDISEIEISKELIRISRLSEKKEFPIIQNIYFSSYSDKSEKLDNSVKKINIPTHNNNEKNNDYIVKSPILGTFYRSAQPNTKPFVEVGQEVKVGDVLCIIEAMKMMNHIKSDINGIIKSILLNDGQTVEFNEPMLIIEILR